MLVDATTQAEARAVRSREAGRGADGGDQAREALHRDHAAVHDVHLRRRRAGDRVRRSTPSAWRCSARATTRLPNARPPGGRGGGGGRGGRGGGGLGGPVRAEFDVNGVEPKKSPDGKLEALVNNYNVAIREPGKPAAHAPQHRRLRRRLLRPRLDRLVAGLEEARRLSRQAGLPPLRALRRVVARGSAAAEALDAAVREARRRARRRAAGALRRRRRRSRSSSTTRSSRTPTTSSPLVWRKDSRAVTFEYNQRGHQVYRVIEVDARDRQGARGRSARSRRRSSTTPARQLPAVDVDDGKEVIWMSERDGWNHLYLFDGATGQVKNQITKGDWVVRGVEQVDEEKRQIWFSASGMYAGQGPVLRPLLPHQLRRHRPDAADRRRRQPHASTFSPDTQVLRRHLLARRPAAGRRSCAATADGSARATLETRRHRRAARRRAGKPPEVFVAKGRDGKTDIWGVIYPADELRPGEEVSGHREHLRRAAGLVRAEVVQRVQRRCRRWPSSASSSCRSTAWARRNRSKAFHDVAGRTSTTPASPIASSGTRRSPRSIRSTTSRASASTAARPAGRTRSAALLFHPRVLQGGGVVRAAATTTAWTRSGGTSSGWAGRSARTTPRRRTSTTRTGCRASCCSSSARWTPTSIRRRRCRSSTR